METNFEAKIQSNFNQFRSTGDLQDSARQSVDGPMISQLLQCIQGLQQQVSDLQSQVMRQKQQPVQSSPYTPMGNRLGASSSVGKFSAGARLPSIGGGP